MKSFSKIHECDVIFVYTPDTQILYLERVGIVNQNNRSITTHFETYNFDLNGWDRDYKVELNGNALFTSIIRCLKYVISQKKTIKQITLKKDIIYKTIDAATALLEVKINKSFLRDSFTLDKTVTQNISY